MLNVYTSSPSVGYFTKATGTVLAVHGSTKQWQTCPLMCFPNNRDGTVVSFKGYISDGAQNKYGERECSHVYYDGDIFLDPELRELPPGAPGNPYENTVITFKGKFYSCIVAPGMKHIEPTFQGVSNKKSIARFNYYRVEEDYHVCGYPRALSSDSSGIWRVQYILCMHEFLDPMFRHGALLSYSVDLPAQDVVPFLDSLGNPGGPFRASNYIERGGTSISPLLVQKQLRLLYHYDVSSLVSFVPEDEDDVWGELAKEAIDSTRYVDTNGLQFLMELKSAEGLVRQITDGYRNVKALSGAYLAYKYGLESQFRDVQAYLKGAHRAMTTTPQPWRSVRSSKRYNYPFLTHEYHYKVLYNCYDNDVIELYVLLNNWGLMPDLEMAWDFVPFSFMVDWFISVGDLLDRFDYIGRSQMYRVLNVTKSIKTSRELSELDRGRIPFPFVGSLKYVTYRRTTQKGLDVPKWKLDRPETFRSIPEATALLIQFQK